MREAAGYADRQQDFDELIRILDSETRLLTPIDPESVAESPTSPSSGEKYYHLTHDYLVPALRRWLTRKQKETRRGRAQLLLEERAELWRAKPEDRFLPSPWEYLRIRLLVPRKDWNDGQQAVMRKAGKFHVVRAAILVLLLSPLCFLGVQAYQGWSEARQQAAQQLVARLANVPTPAVPVIAEQLISPRYRKWAVPIVLKGLEDAKADSLSELHYTLAALKLFPEDTSRLEFLAEKLESAEPEQFGTIIESLENQKGKISDILLATVTERAPADASDAEQESFAKRQANSAAALLHFGLHESDAWPVLKHSKEPAGT